MVFDDDDTRIATLSERPHEAHADVTDKAYLIVLAGSNVGEMFCLDKETIIGRGETASVRLFDDGISRQHARILLIGDEVIIEDLKSANGTLVNGQTISLHALRDGDKIRLGSTTILKFTYHDKLDELFQQKMYDAALRDGLTKVFNKRFFLERIENEFAFAKRHKSPLSLAMFDVDFFKKINDTYGHLTGDYVLTKIAQLAMATVRNEDILARYGGEEFAVLCRGIQIAQAATMAERLRQLIETTLFEHNGQKIPVTVSIGVAGFPEITTSSGMDLVHRADEALYEAKRTGRNRVVARAMG